MRFAQLVGLPRSIGELFGLLFASDAPLALDELVDLLGVSKGSASQGLKFLRSVGAIRPVMLPGDRRQRFVPETELRQLVSGLLREKVVPHLEGGADHLARLAAIVPPSHELQLRLNKLRIWHEKARQFLPLIQAAVRE